MEGNKVVGISCFAGKNPQNCHLQMFLSLIKEENRSGAMVQPLGVCAAPAECSQLSKLPVTPDPGIQGRLLDTVGTRTHVHICTSGHTCSKIEPF